MWPTGQTRPNTSANNAEPGLVSANSAIFQLGTDGKLSVFNQQGTVNVIMDVTGYFLAARRSHHDDDHDHHDDRPVTRCRTEPTPPTSARPYRAVDRRLRRG